MSIFSPNKTKVVATIGPITSSEEMIEKLILAGVNVFRFNFSHNNYEFYIELTKRVRDVALRLDAHIGILQDISGPKVRLLDVETPFFIHHGDSICFSKKGDTCSRDSLGINYPQILDQVEVGSRIYIADGMIRLEVVGVDADKVYTIVNTGGKISSRKGVNFPNIKLNISSVTEKDIADIRFGVELGLDFVAMSFVKSASDIKHVKEIIKEKGGFTPVIAKIEKHEAVTNIDEIIDEADGIMIARGDLGVEVELEKVPVIQKLIIKKANEKCKPVITATQMLTSMITQPRPTRAEVSDIANAVLDGTDAVMLSDETAMGEKPVEAVEVMIKTIFETEKIYQYYINNYNNSKEFAIPSAGCSLAEDISAKAIAVFTTTGSSAKKCARYRPYASVYANVHKAETARQLALVWGVTPIQIFADTKEPEHLIKYFINKAVSIGILHEGDSIVVTMGYPSAKPGATNLLKVVSWDEIKSKLES